MKKCRFFLVVLASLVFCLSGSLVSVSATEVSQKGFVEYQTEASINFKEVIEVILTDKETGNYYKQMLYRINDYKANASVGFGTYTVQVRVVDASDPSIELSQYVAVCSVEEITVMNARVAVPISIRIEEFIMTDVSDEATGDIGGTGNMGDSALVDSDIDQAPSGEGASGKGEAAAPGGEDTEEQKEKDAPLWVSLLISVGILAVLGAVFLFLKKRESN